MPYLMPIHVTGHSASKAHETLQLCAQLDRNLCELPRSQNSGPRGRARRPPFRARHVRACRHTSLRATSPRASARRKPSFPRNVAALVSLSGATSVGTAATADRGKPSVRFRWTPTATPRASAVVTATADDEPFIITDTLVTQPERAHSHCRRGQSPTGNEHSNKTSREIGPLTHTGYVTIPSSRTVE
jgi:hypothetical protein